MYLWKWEQGKGDNLQISSLFLPSEKGVLLHFLFYPSKQKIRWFACKWESKRANAKSHLLLHISKSLDSENVNGTLAPIREGWEMDSVELVTSHSPLQDAHIELHVLYLWLTAILPPFPTCSNLSDKKGVQTVRYKNVLIPVSHSFSWSSNSQFSVTIFISRSHFLQRHHNFQVSHLQTSSLLPRGLWKSRSLLCWAVLQAAGSSHAAGASPHPKNNTEFKLWADSVSCTSTAEYDWTYPGGVQCGHLSKVNTGRRETWSSGAPSTGWHLCLNMQKWVF